MDDRDVVVRAIARQITSPAGTAITDVDAWDDERLQVVLRRLLAEDNWLEHVEPSTVTIASFRAAVRRQTDKFTEQMNRLVLPMRAMARSAYQHAAIADSLDHLRSQRIGIDALRILNSSMPAVRAQNDLLGNFEAGHGFSTVADALFQGSKRRPLDEAIQRLTAASPSSDDSRPLEAHAAPAQEVVSVSAVSVGLEDLVALTKQELEEARRRTGLSENQVTRLGDLLREARETTKWARLAALLAGASLIAAVLTLLWR